MALGIEGVRVGVWTHPQGHTGCTVVLPPPGALGAVAVRGGAPGTREAAALGATGTVTACDAVVLSGGSAFGLATADGVSAWCEEQGIGHDTGVARVPIVGAAIVFDLRSPRLPRPDHDAGRAACDAAGAEDPPMGRVGVGAGCTVGKAAGLAFGVPGGQGHATVSGGGATVGALVACNALGDVLAPDGTVLVGSRAPADAPRFPETGGPPPRGGGNTVIGCLVTDVALTKPEAVRAADLASTGIARTVEPPHTSYDGDALFLLSTGTRRVDAPVDLVAYLGARAVAAAIRAGVSAGHR